MTTQEDLSAHEVRSKTSTSFVEGIRSRSPEGWERLVETFGPTIYWASRRAGLNAEDAADITQDVFLAVAKSIDHFRHDQPGDSFRKWIWTILNNKIRDRFRRRESLVKAQGGTTAQYRVMEIPEPPNPEDPSSLSGSGGVLLRRALELVHARFENKTWAAFWKTVVECQSPAAVAEELGMTLHAVYKAKSRGLTRLRQEYSELAQ